MIKKLSKILFVFFIGFMFCSSISAKEQITCKYTGTSLNEWDIEWTKTLELDLILTDNETQVQKINYSIVGDSQCKEKVQQFVGWSNKELEDYCTQKLSYSASDVESGIIDFDIVILEGESCPDNVDIDLVSQPRRIYKGSALKLQKTNRTFLGKVSCGNITKIPKIVPKLTSLAITIVQIAVPVILVLMGSLDLFKGITAGKEDEMKKGQQMFIKRLIVGALVFFVVVIVKFLISVVADTNVNNMVDCVDCFISNNC